MSDEEKTLRIRILTAKLARSEQQVAEAQLERMQRALAYREQEAEFEFNKQRRVEIMKEVEGDKLFDKEKRRPSMFMYTEIYFDEDEEKFACRHEGVTAHGDTPSMACENFDHLWMYGK